MFEPAGHTCRFGPFEVDVQTGELTRDGCRVPVPWQSAVLLRLLVARPGEVVTREEVRRTLWPNGMHVDYDHGLNNAVARLRRALGDSAEAPRFIETLPRVGYRLIVPVTQPTSLQLPVLAAATSAAASPLSRTWWALAAAVLFAVGLGIGTVLPSRSAPAWTDTPAAAEARDQAERSLAYTRLVLAGVLAADVASAAANDASTRALALDPTLAVAHLAAGYTAMWARWDWAAADRLFRTALSLDPRSARIHHAHALWLSAHGQHDEALRAINLAAGFDDASLDIARDWGRLAFVAGDVNFAVGRLQLLLTRHPDDADAHDLISQALSSQGRNAEAATHLARYLVLIGVEERYARNDARKLADEGMTGLYRWWMSKPSSKPEDRYGVPFKLASSHAIIGNLDAALVWLQRARSQRDIRLLFVNVDPRFEPLRADPRFRQLVQQVGL
jgi:DNA-binding winged helix-turn-helix (wHTH) protein